MPINKYENSYSTCPVYAPLTNLFEILEHSNIFISIRDDFLLQ